MNHRITSRPRDINSAWGATGLLAVLLLNAVVLPCAMAAGLDDPGCLHSPPPVEQQHEMAGHQGHHGHQAGEAGPDCADAHCCDVGMANVDSRSGPQKVRDAGDWDAPPISQTAAPAACRAAWADTVERPPDQPGAFPPRHKLFCVYLD